MGGFEMAIAYGLMLLIAIVLFIVYCLVIKKKEKWLTVFLLLFTSFLGQYNNDTL